MLIYNDTFIPYEFDTRHETLAYILERARYARHSVKLIEKDKEHLTLRCPVSGDYLDVVGGPLELQWLHEQLRFREMYRIT